MLGANYLGQAYLGQGYAEGPSIRSLIFVELLTLSDTTIKQGSRAFHEVLTLTETITRSSSKNFLEILTIMVTLTPILNGVFAGWYKTTKATGSWTQQVKSSVSNWIKQEKL